MKVELILSFIIFVLLFSNSIYALGIRPGKIELTFMPNQEYNLSFTPIFDSEDTIANFSVEGDFSEFITIKKTLTSAGESANAVLKFPEKIETPGSYSSYVCAAQVSSSEGMIGSLAKVCALIRIFVPYEGRYVVPTLNIPSINVGEKLNIQLGLANKGTLDALVASKVIISDSFGKSLGVFSFEPVEVKSLNGRSVSQKIDTTGWKPASYYAETDIAYDGPKINANITFNVGTLFVNITNYTREIVKSGIQKFYIYIENGWNGDLSEVFAEVNLTNNNEEIIFRTPSILLSAWSNARLEGFIDTEYLELGEHDIVMTLYYDREKTIVKERIKIIMKKSYLFWIIAGIILIVIGFLAVMFWRKKNAYFAEKRK